MVLLSNTHPGRRSVYSFYKYSLLYSDVNLELRNTVFLLLWRKFSATLTIDKAKLYMFRIFLSSIATATLVKARDSLLDSWPNPRSYFAPASLEEVDTGAAKPLVAAWTPRRTLLPRGRMDGTEPEVAAWPPRSTLLPPDRMDDVTFKPWSDYVDPDRGCERTTRRGPPQPSVLAYNQRVTLIPCSTGVAGPTVKPINKEEDLAGSTSGPINYEEDLAGPTSGPINNEEDPGVTWRPIN